MGSTLDELEVRLPSSTSPDLPVTSPQRNYCPPVDTALFQAIVSDFDLEDPDSLQTACDTLDRIKSNAEVEECTLLELSDNEAAHDSISFDESPEPGILSDHGKALSGGTETTSLTQSIASATLADRDSPEKNEDAFYDADIESASDEEKITLLLDVVPGLKTFDVGFALKKHHGNFKRTLDELLSLAYIKESAEAEDALAAKVPKGIDGFAEPAAKKKRKGKKKNRGTDEQQADDSSAPTSEPSASKPKVWDVTKEDIFFISSRTCLGWSFIQHIYFQNGASVAQTIAALCRSDQVDAKRRTIADPTLDDKFLEFGFAYYKIHPKDRQALVVLTHPNLEAAYELAEVLMAPKQESFDEYQAKKEIVPQYKKANVTPAVPFTKVVGRKASPRPPPAPARQVPGASYPASYLAPPAYTAPPPTADFAARSASAYAQAADAYRRARSKPLLAAAAGYYAAEGRAAAARASQQVSVVAQAHVAAQSSTSSLDLHGVTVKDAVAIALDRVEKWWDNTSAKEWAREGKLMSGEELRIVCGAGRHSEGGKAKIGPAVKKALSERRWRVNEAEPGVLVVRGKMRA